MARDITSFDPARANARRGTSEVPFSRGAKRVFEAALQECKRLADYHMTFLSSWFPGAATRNSRLDVPWSLSRWERKKDAIDPVLPTEVFGADLAQVLRGRHRVVEQRLQQVDGDDELHLGAILVPLPGSSIPVGVDDRRAGCGPR